MSGVKCINKLLSIILCLSFLLTASGCGGTNYAMPYSANGPYAPAAYVTEVSQSKAPAFASSISVVSTDVQKGSFVLEKAGTAGLFDVNNKVALYTKNVHEKVYPASLTKVMTAVVALEYVHQQKEEGRILNPMGMDLVVTENTLIKEAGAATAKLNVGDHMTLDQALHILLIVSANDVANLIAENVGGSIDHFVEMMNEKAKELGATNTHFTNAHGLTDLDHYTTAYDLYLIFNEAIKYDEFNQIINMTSYQTTFKDKNGKDISKDYKNTSLYFKGEVTAPENVTILGGKTGTTNAAGHCLILHCKDVKGNDYVAVVMRCLSNDVLYAEMNELLKEINN